MMQSAGVRPSNSFAGNTRALAKSTRVQQRVAARPATAMATAALDEVPTPEKRVRPTPATQYAGGCRPGTTRSCEAF